MAKPLAIALPPQHVLTGGYQIVVTALDPDTGAVVSGVTVSNVTMQVESFNDTGLASGAFVVVNPVLIPAGTLT